ncbi:MAG: hypothetical protein JO145_15270 [Acidobacteriaceae bacterium]|nr:hypothetical protein [Acidobacteriaceae bacterium]
MHWSRIAQYISNCFALALIIRLLILRLHTVYRVFCLFLLWELLASGILMLGGLDYRLSWMGTRIVSWVLSLYMVYALLEAVLATFPGILRFSRRALNVTFTLAVLLALLTAFPEYSASALTGSSNPIDRALGVAFVLERAISLAALLALLSILGFILWFPIRMPRNLAIFSVGYVIYFAAKTALLLARSYLAPERSDLFSVVLNVILTGCFIYWIMLISRQGEIARVQIGHSWHLVEQKRLIGQLEAINTALLRASRR